MEKCSCCKGFFNDVQAEAGLVLCASCVQSYSELTGTCSKCDRLAEKRLEGKADKAYEKANTLSDKAISLAFELQSPCWGYLEKKRDDIPMIGNELGHFFHDHDVPYEVKKVLMEAAEEWKTFYALSQP